MIDEAFAKHLVRDPMTWAFPKAFFNTGKGGTVTTNPSRLSIDGKQS